MGGVDVGGGGDDVGMLAGIGVAAFVEAGAEFEMEIPLDLDRDVGGEPQGHLEGGPVSAALGSRGVEVEGGSVGGHLGLEDVRRRAFTEFSAGFDDVGLAGAVGGQTGANGDELVVGHHLQIAANGEGHHLGGGALGTGLAGGLGVTTGIDGGLGGAEIKEAPTEVDAGGGPGAAHGKAAHGARDIAGGAEAFFVFGQEGHRHLGPRRDARREAHRRVEGAASPVGLGHGHLHLGGGHLAVRGLIGSQAHDAVEVQDRWSRRHRTLGERWGTQGEDQEEQGRHDRQGWLRGQGRQGGHHELGKVCAE